MDKMTFKLHIPTEQYGFIEQTLEGTPEDAVSAYRQLQREWNGGEGLDPKEWRELLDSYLATGSMKPDMQEYLERCDKVQKWTINEIKKSIIRINKKNS